MTDTIVYVFTTANCPRCRLFLPTFEAWAVKYGDRADFVQVHLDVAPAETIEQLRVTAVPTVAVVKGEKEIARFVGAPKEGEIARLLEADDNPRDGDTTETPPSETGG
jgi:thioredoxin-like negative regulator of GroEL